MIVYAKYECGRGFGKWGGGAAMDEATSRMVRSEMNSFMKNVTPTVDHGHFPLTKSSQTAVNVNVYN